MLRTLTVRNFAIIDSLDLEFGPGFNVMTGETGAGKSIIMQALNLILGGRAGSEMVRSGAAKASVDAQFDVSGSPGLAEAIAEMGFDLEEDQLLLSREIASTGKSTCRVCGRPAGVAQLKEIGEWLVDLHGQHEHQSLLMVQRHIDVLDAWGGQLIDAARIAVAAAHTELSRLRAERSALDTDARERAHLLDLYTFQVAEIRDARLVAGEDLDLAAEYSRAANIQRLTELAGAVNDILGGGDMGGVVASLATAVRMLEEIAQLDSSLQGVLDTVRSAGYELAEAERDVARYEGSLEADPERLATIEERLELIRTLRRKYGNNVEEILAYGRETAEKAEKLANSDERSTALAGRVSAQSDALEKACNRLSTLRESAARKFEKAVVEELRSLSMDKTRFHVRIDKSDATARGVDKIEFEIATNPGEPMRPLARVASGGEISRVMLAIKSAMALREALPTMVFDEIDVGVGGRTASVIADKMCVLSETAQVLCITHLAQIASRGKRHFYIVKREASNRTFVSVSPIDGETRVAEIARMIGGADITETVMNHAREMLTA